MENKVINQQLEMNKVRAEIEIKKGAIKAYQMHIKEKAIRRKNRIALLKRQQKRCPDCDIGFLTDAKLQKHIEKIHTEDKDYMLQIAKDFNDKLVEEDMEDREEIKDIVEATHSKIETLIRNETSELRQNLAESKRRREEELNRLQQQYLNEQRKRDDEKHYAAELITQSQQRLQQTAGELMKNFNDHREYHKAMVMFRES